MFKDNWIEFINGRKWYPTHLQLTKPEDFNKHLDFFLEQSIKRVHEMTRNGSNEAQVIAYMKDQFQQSDVRNIKTTYMRMHDSFKVVLNERHQEARADMKERIRYFIFRMLTAIVIATVVMGTYYLAGEWGIQLPMTRAVLGAPL
ncbi:MAG: hypothetical protein KME67_08950 [Candidatus Thiodiazotropha sp. (ex Codakia orbicularis)]|nr:hypothetical protein [Candidatus Thiodiazotropha sp. (ex Codakia orbicularis)]